MKKRRYVQWTPGLRGAVRAKLRSGWSLPRVAQHYDISLSTLQKACAKYGMSEPPSDLMLMTEFAELAGLSVPAAARMAETTGLTVTKWARYRAVPRQAAERVLEARPNPADAVDRIPDGHYTVTQLAKLWSVDPGVIYDGVSAEDIPYQLARPSANRRFVRCYHLADVEHLRPETVPVPLRGTLTTQQLAELLHMTDQAIWQLVRKGMPKLERRTRQGAMLFRPQEVAGWLCARHDVRTRRKGERLLRILKSSESSSSDKVF